MIKLAILWAVSCLCLCAQQASLDGVTVDAVTQLPLAGVHISLVSTGAGTNLPEPDDAYGAISDRAGRYSIGNIRPGAYILNPQRTGFVYVPEKDIAATPTITLKAEERKTGYSIVMTPETTITGRVLDEFGDPVQGATVRAVSPADSTPYGIWSLRDETDDRGEYRINGMPGKYFIEASVHPLQTSGPPEIRTDGSSTTAYATTYYPGALAKERAKVVDAPAGQELSGIDIHVAHRKSLRISGVVTGLPAAGASGSVRAVVTIRLYYDDHEAVDTTVAAADGGFAFAGLAPAEYHLAATFPSSVPGADPLHSPNVKVTVENDDATVTLPVSAGEEMAGTLRVEGGGSDDKWTVRLAAADFDGTPTKGGEVAPDGTFTISRIIPGVFRAVVDPLPDNAYIKSLLLGGNEAVDTELDLSAGVRGATLKVTVSRNGGQISGSISKEDGSQTVGRGLFVVLAADTSSFSTWRSAISSDSTFAIRGIRPGKYRLFAIDPLQFGRLRSYEPLKAIAARADEIEIKEGDRLTKDLRVMGKGDAGAK